MVKSPPAIIGHPYNTQTGTLPHQTLTIARGHRGGTFEKLCYIDWPTNDFIGNGNDFVIVVSNNFTHCIEACASFNMLKRNSSIPNCVGVSFRPTEATMDGAHLGNCNLKDTLDGVAENVHLNYVVLSALALN